MNNSSKIPIKNIYYMLSYAFTTLDRSYDEDIAGEEFENIHNLFAAILSKGISHQLKQGLYREYINREEQTVSVHGKINAIKTMRNQYEHKKLVSCEFDELSVNNIYNSVIKTTAWLLIRHRDVKSEYKDTLRKEMSYFHEIEYVDPIMIDWSKFSFHRNNQTYKMLLGISQMVLEGMLLTTDDGSYRLAQFVDEQRMCRLYEKFILEYYRKEIPAIRAESSQIQWALDDGNKALLPMMQSDIMLSYKNDILIIDAKYYTNNMNSHYDNYTIHNANLNQIFTYVKNKQAEPQQIHSRVAGMLLYAQTTNEIQPNGEYSMSGNKIYVQTLDLNCEFKSVAKQLNIIIKKHFKIDI